MGGPRLARPSLLSPFPSRHFNQRHRLHLRPAGLQILISIRRTRKCIVGGKLLMKMCTVHYICICTGLSTRACFTSISCHVNVCPSPLSTLCTYIYLRVHVNTHRMKLFAVCSQLLSSETRTSARIVQYGPLFQIDH